MEALITHTDGLMFVILLMVAFLFGSSVTKYLNRWDLF